EAQRQAQDVGVDLGPHRRHRPRTGEGEEHRHEVGGQRPQPGDRDDTHGAQDEHPDDARVLRRAGGDDGVDDEAQRPGLEQPEGDLGEEREEAADDDPAVRPQVGSQEAPDPPQRGQDGPEVGRRLLLRHQATAPFPVPAPQAHVPPAAEPPAAPASASAELSPRAELSPAATGGTLSSMPAAARDRATTWVQVWPATTCSRAAAPTRARRRRSAASSRSASAGAAGSEPGPRKPVRRWSTTRGSCPTAEATTGRPAAMYS